MRSQFTVAVGIFVKYVFDTAARKIGDDFGIQQNADDSKMHISGIKTMNKFFKKRHTVFVLSRSGERKRVFNAGFIIFFRYEQKTFGRIVALNHITRYTGRNRKGVFYRIEIHRLGKYKTYRLFFRKIFMDREIGKPRSIGRHIRYGAQGDECGGIRIFFRRKRIRECLLHLESVR